MNLIKPIKMKRTSAIVPVVLGISIAILLFRFNTQEIIMLLLLIMCIIPSIIAVYRGSVDLFEPIIFYSVFMFMTVIAIFDRIYIQDPFLRHSEWISWDFSTAFLIVSSLYLLFFALVLVGYYLKIEERVDIPTFDLRCAKYDSGTFRYIGAIYMSVGLLFYIALVGSALDWNLFRLYTTTEPRSQLFSGSHHLLLGSRMTYIGYLIWLISPLVDEKRPRILYLLPGALISSLFLMLGGRQRAITIILITTIIYYYSYIYPTVNIDSNRIRLSSDCFHQKLKLLAIPFIGVLSGVVITLTGIIRSWRNLGDEFGTRTLIDMMTFGIHNNHLDYFLVTLQVVPDHFGYYGGSRIFRVPINFIPRSLWNDKPVLTVGSDLRQEILPNQAGGRDPGILGYLYADGGVVGILIGAIIFGVLLRILYVSFVQNSKSPIILLLYSVILSSLVPGGIGNNALWEILNHLLLFSPLLIFILYMNDDLPSYV